MALATENHKRQRMKTCIKNPFLLTVLIGGLGLVLAGRVAAQTFTTLHYFDDSDYGDGSDPQAGLIISGNTLYGATDGGGSAGSGAVFAVNTDGTGFTNLYSFTVTYGDWQDSTNSDGNSPDGTLALSGNTLYGTAFWGGTNGNGTLFGLNTNGTGFTNLHSFAAGVGSFPYNYTNSDGACPEAGLILSGNTLFGTTEHGGASGFGAVFKVNTDGTGFTNLHSFAGGTNGAVPEGLLLSGNTLYGVAQGFYSSNGTVFRVNTDGTDFTNLHNFTAASGSNHTNSDGASPSGRMVLSGNTLYGTAYQGGSAGNGTVFRVNTDGTDFTNLHNFTATNAPNYTNSDGASPVGSMILSGNTLYGTAYYGGSAGNGTVFALNTNGAAFTILHTFTAMDANGNNSDGANPEAGLLLSGNTLYGTAKHGGSAGDGTVFSISLALVVTTTSLPNGMNGVAYNQTLAATGGQKPYSWTNSSGVLPPGLTLATSGLLSGTPTTNGTNHFTVKVTDAFSATATQPLTLTVGSPPSVTLQPTNSSVTVPVGSNVTFTVSVAGTGPFSYQWQLNGTNLPNGIITTVAGNGYGAGTDNGGYSGDGGAATNAELCNPQGVAVDATDNLFIADLYNNVIRKVGTNGIITTVVGNGYDAGTDYGGYSGDGGAATNAELDGPSGVAVDVTGNLFIADSYNNVIRKVGTNGIIITVVGNGYGAGNGNGGYSGDGGAATNAELCNPQGVAVDATGNLFIADSHNNVIRKVGTNGIINTVAGIGYGCGAGSYSGDGGAATNAELNYPIGLAVDATGNLFIADYGNNVIRKVGTNGIIITVAGNGYTDQYGYGGFSGDGGTATNAELNSPSGVAVDTTGNVFIVDDANMRIRKVGTSGIITTVAGNGYGAGSVWGTGGYSGDGGPATNAELNSPFGMAVDATGNQFIADSYNQRIRKVIIPSPTLALGDVGFGNAGAYGVVVSSPYGSVTSSVVNLTIISAPVVLSAPQITGGNADFTFLLSGPSGSNYVLQVSTNLFNWSPVSTSTIPVSGSITLSNAISGYSRRFYRVYQQ